MSDGVALRACKRRAAGGAVGKIKEHDLVPSGQLSVAEELRRTSGHETCAAQPSVSRTLQVDS